MELSQKHCKWFSQAGVIAQDSDMLFKLGCLATYGGKCIATGCNNKNSYSKYDDFCNFTCSCHAEINVIRKCIKKLGKEILINHFKNQGMRYSETNVKNILDKFKLKD